MVAAAGRRRRSTFALVGATGKGHVRRRRHGDVIRGVRAGIVKLRLAAVFDAQHGGFATGWSPVSWGSIDELFVNLTILSGRHGRRRSSTFALGDATGKGNVCGRRHGNVQAYSLPLSLFLRLHLSSSSASSVSPRQYRSSISSISSSLSPK